MSRWTGPCRLPVSPSLPLPRLVYVTIRHLSSVAATYLLKPNELQQVSTIAQVGRLVHIIASFFNTRSVTEHRAGRLPAVRILHMQQRASHGKQTKQRAARG